MIKPKITWWIDYNWKIIFFHNGNKITKTLENMRAGMFLVWFLKNYRQFVRHMINPSRCLRPFDKENEKHDEMTCIVTLTVPEGQWKSQDIPVLHFQVSSNIPVQPRSTTHLLLVAQLIQQLWHQRIWLNLHSGEKIPCKKMIVSIKLITYHKIIHPTHWEKTR